MNMDQFIVRPGQKTTEEKTQVINVHRTVKGFYKASIMEPDASGTINEAFSTGWKPNTILNSGLDKIAYMPWAQTFQFCLIGDYPYTGADPVTASYSETMLKKPKRINAFYLPGQGNCGHVISGSTVRLFRTFDFYKEIDNVTYTEVGFKETPAATTLFSKIRFDPTMSLHAGQFMRVSYELRVNLNPATGSTGGVSPSPFPSFTGWTTGSLDKEAIQKVGLCGIDTKTGLATPIDEGGFCNEPFAPGQLSFGPAFGFVNRYYNGSNVNYYQSASSTYEPIAFKAVDDKVQPIYHTNVMMCMANQFVVICLDSIPNKQEKQMLLDSFVQTHKEVIEISQDQLNHFAGNMLQVFDIAEKPYLIMSEQAYTSLNAAQLKSLEKYNPLIPIAIPTIEALGGGSTRCMMAEIYLIKVFS